MAPLLYLLFLVAVGGAVVAINVVLWRKLGRWFQKDDAPATFGLLASRLSILLTFNAWLLGALLVLEARSVFGFKEAAPIHLTASREQGIAIVVAMFAVACATPFIVAAALICGVTGFVSGRRAGDVRATRIGLIGVAMNSLLIILCCGMLGGFFGGGSGSPAEREKIGGPAEENAQ